MDELNADQKKKLYPMSNTEGHLAMTDLLAGESSTSWMTLWESGDMAVVPGVGRFDHQRSHFEVKDAAAKGVSTTEEPTTRHGWLAKSIFAFNSLYCQWGESEEDCHKTANRTRMVDGISLMNSAAGPNALEVSDSSISGSSFLHISGVNNVDAVLDTELYNYDNPFVLSADDLGSGGSPVSSGQGMLNPDHSGDENDGDDMGTLETNHALADLLDKESTTFHGIGVVQELLSEYMVKVAERCPLFPDMEEWADSESDGEIGMQLRAVAILIINNVRPKVFQLQHGSYDTHSAQASTMATLLADLRTGVFTFVRAAKECGFWDDVLVTIFSEFGRRLEENSKQGTDHGWGHYLVLFGQNLQRQVYGYSVYTNTSTLGSLVPSHLDSYNQTLGTKGDLRMTTDIEAFNACVLDALGLPGLWRLGDCPSEMRLRANLGNVPRFDETLYYADSVASGGSGTGSGNANLAWDGNKAYLDKTLTSAEVLHFSRRVGYSPKSLGLEDHLASNYSGAGITLREAISVLLADENIQQGLDATPKVYVNYQYRRTTPINLYSETLWDANVWQDVHELPYPRVDTFEARVSRWGMEGFFDMASLSVTAGGMEGLAYHGAVALNSEYVGREGVVLQEIKAQATVFHHPDAIYLKDGVAYGKLRTTWDATTGMLTIEAADTIDWYQTVMRAADVRQISTVTVEQIVEDWRCDAATGTSPSNPAVSCDPSCDLETLLNVSFDEETAFLKNPGWRGVDGSRETATFRVLKECTNLINGDADRKQYEKERNKQMKDAVAEDLYTLYFTHMNNPAAGLRARMTWFFLNWFATPLSAIDDDHLLMYQQFDTLWTQALGDYRALAVDMFNDGALRKSLDQLDDIVCGTAPVENFAREYFERFTVGLEAHNEGDIKRLSKALMNCKHDHETENQDLTMPGIIFSDLNEEVWTLTEADQRAVVDRVLDFKMVASEPPAAAQRLCDKLYREFGTPPMVGEHDTLSSVLMPPSVVECARKLYDNNYNLLSALQHILEDKPHFKDTLGQKSRWPKSLIFGPCMDFDIPMTLQQWMTWTKNVGMPAFEPQDVSGYDLDDVWTLDRVAYAHEFLSTKATRSSLAWFDSSQFESMETMQSALAAYRLPGTFELYSFVPHVCDFDLFVPEEGEDGSHIINATYLFDTSVREHHRKSQRYKIWKHAVELAVTNVCQFLS